MSFSSFYIGATGMKTHAAGLQVVGNNLANVNTVGYKESAYRFENLMAKDSSHGSTLKRSGSSGQGVGLQTVATDFSQGSLLSTNTVTDVSISGKGFYGVSDLGDIFYTRAGNFRFNTQGQLVDPHGYVVQGTAGDIQLAMVNGEPAPMDPQATSQAEIMTNLSGGDNSGSGSTDPFFGLFANWDGSSTANPGLATGTYAYADSIRVYDDAGTGHDLTVHYDLVNSSSLSGAGSTQYWEYLVSIDPSEDGRAGLAGTSNAGLLMTGTMAFNTAGALQTMSAFSYSGTGSAASLSNWTPATPVNGSFQVSPTYVSSAATPISLNFGLTLTGAAGAAPTSAATVGADPDNLPDYSGSPTSVSTTAYQGSSSTLRLDQDGYPEGYLQNISITTDGVIVGRYSNSQSQDLAQFQLYRFPSEYNLHREGSNLFSESLTSGTAITGTPGDAGFGEIQANTLENSNVDMAREFVIMISTQRGFQANSKIITTSDTMLQTAVNLKR